MEAKLPIYKRIKKLRKSRGLSQMELADKVKTDVRMISQYEKGKSLPLVEYVIKLAEIFNVSIDYLLMEEAPIKPLKQNGDRELIEQLGEIDKLDEADKDSVIQIIRYLFTKKIVKDVVTKAG
jgi:transcriptional regulator with XRE-family HTH domain